MPNKLSEISSPLLSLAAAVLLFLSSSTWAAQAAPALSLAEASERLISQSPELKQFEWRFSALEAAAELAKQRPVSSLGLEVADIAGSGDYAGVKAAETTLSFSSVLELGNKRSARLGASQAQLALAQAEQDALLVTRLAELTQTYVITLALQQQCQLKEEAVVLAKRTLSIVQERVRKAAAPEAEQLRAKVALVQAELDAGACAAELDASRHTLAKEMGQSTVDFGGLSGDLLLLRPLPERAELQAQLESSPVFLVYQQQQNAQEAELAGLKANNALDLSWSVGLSHYQETDDTALGLGLSVPLFTGTRNQPKLSQARAKAHSLSLERQQAKQSMLAKLSRELRLHQQHAQNLTRLQTDALPLLERAYSLAQQAYSQGRYSYSEWVNARQELLATKAAIIDAARDAWLNQASIEALLGGL